MSDSNDIPHPGIQSLIDCIRERRFTLAEADLAKLEQDEDIRVAGWVFAYRVYRAGVAQSVELLRDGLSDPNPRIREQACDIIGDNEVRELRLLLKPLFTDAEGYVSEASRYNHDEMFDD